MEIQITPNGKTKKKKKKGRRFDENQKNKRFIVMDKQYDDGFLKTKNSIRTINFYHVKTV